MRHLNLTIARFCLAAWAGAAALFVVTSVREQIAPDFDQQTRAALALVRFPAYYLFGFALNGVALLTAFPGLRAARPGRRWLCCGLIAAALAAMAFDYVRVYQPLSEMMTLPPGRRPAESFRAYHVWSMWVNLVHVSFSFSAAWVACWPVPAAAQALQSSEAAREPR